MGKVYAVRVGRKTGIFEKWADCQAQTNGYPGSSFRGCANVAEAQAWLDDFHQSAGNVFPSKDPSTTRSTAGARTSAAPYSIPNMGQKLLGKQKAQAPNHDHELDDALSNAIVAYTDGASKNNQDAKLRIAGYGIHWAHGRPTDVEGDIAARCPGEGQTNNIGELLAIIRALELTRNDPRPLRIYSDSKYSIDCFKWVHGWAANNWKKKDGSDIANVEMIRYMDALRRLRGVQDWKFEIHHVKGHAASTGNNAADRLANQGCLLPLDKTEPDWDSRFKEVDACIKQIGLDKVRDKGQPVKLQTVVKEDTAEAILTTEPAKVSTTSTGKDEFSGIHILSNDEMLEELATA